MQNFEVWIEGYAATGEAGTAQLLGIYPAKSFNDAIQAYNENTKGKNPGMKAELSAKTGNWTIWGCVLYSNEVDARKYFG